MITPARSPGHRASRYSSGWVQMRKFLESKPALRVLDLGPTSPGNINYLTGLGHSVYMSNLVEEAAQPEWWVHHDGEEEKSFNVEHFIADQMDFSGRSFDVVFFWDTADYLPEELLGPVLDRLHAVMGPGGQLLAMFHAPPAPGAVKPAVVKAEFNRYHLTEENKVEAQRMGEYPLLHSYTNRQIEKLFEQFKAFHFFLTKDNMREVVVTR